MGRIYKRDDTWYIDVKANGRRIRKRVGRSKRDAENALRLAEAQIVQRKFGGFSDNDLTIEELFERFNDYSLTNHRSSTTRRYGTIIKHFRNFVKEKRSDIVLISQISEEVMESYKAYRKNSLVNPNGMIAKSGNDVREYTRKGARARTINIEVDGIKMMLNLAVRWGFISQNPLSKLKPLKEDDKKPMRFLSEEEYQRFLDATPPDLYPIFFTFLNTGMRKAELENLQWCDIDLKRRVISIQPKEDWKPKTGERKIPISAVLHPVLVQLKKDSKSKLNQDYVFAAGKKGHSHNRLRRELIRIAKVAEIKDLTKLHTLRHTFASHLVMKGVDLPTVMKIMGHSDIQTTMIYAHLAPDHLADAVDKLAF